MLRSVRIGPFFHEKDLFNDLIFQQMLKKVKLLTLLWLGKSSEAV